MYIELRFRLPKYHNYCEGYIHNYTIFHMCDINKKIYKGNSRMF